MRTGDFRPWAAWIYCLTLVNYQPTPSRLIVRGRLMLVQQGEFFVTQENLARQMRWESRKPVRNFFATLRQLGRIGPQEGPFQVLNWQDYNDIQGQRKGHKRATEGPQGGHLQEEKHEALSIETQEPSSPPKRTAPRKARAKTHGDPRVGEFEHWWGVAFQERFKIPYVCQFAADGKQLKVALAGLDAGGGDTMATLERAATRFLADDSRRKYGGHTIRNFCSQLNSYTVDEPPKPARDDETVPIIHDIEAADAFKEQWAKDTAETKARVRAELEAKR